MSKVNNYFKLCITAILLVVVAIGCEDRLGIVSPPVITTPTVISTSPANLITGVAFNSRITATFSEAMNSSSITSATFTLMQGTSFVSGTVSYAALTATFIPSSNLTPNTVYTATITTGTKDAEGTSLASNYVWSFSTGSAPIVVAPSVNSTDPINSETGVAFNQKIAATFSVPMNTNTFTSATFILKQGTTPVPGLVSYAGTTATFAPTVNLKPNTAYSATITTGVTNLSSVPMENNYTWSFTTGAAAVITPPLVSSTDPGTNDIGVAFNQKIAATFSKTMDASTFTAAAFTLKQGTTAVAGFVSYSGITATFAPAANLSPNTVYTATITTAVKDLAGNALAADYVWNFTTGSAALITPPEVTNTDPLNAAIGVAFNQKVAATFSKTMDATTITTATFTLMQGASTISGFISYSGTTATFSPAANLMPNTTYSAKISTGAKDLAGNAMANDYMWSFTTGAAAVVTPPQVNSTDPANTAIGVALNQKISATFTKTMDASTISAATYTLKQGTNSISGFVSYTGTTATFDPAVNLSPNTLYTVTITTGAKDLTGNALAANYVWSFTTGAATVIVPPTVISTDPLNNATNVALNQKIAATFSKTMDATTITSSTFTLKQGALSVPGFTSYSGTTAIFAPAANLSPNTVYTATITTGAKDLANNAIAANYVWTFTTGAATVIIPPTVIMTDPLNTALAVPLNKKVTAVFSKTMDASTITTSNFTLMQGSTFVSGTVSYSGTTATYTPSSNLTQNTVYTATITTGAKDLSGNPMIANYVWSFTTSITQYSATLSSLPADGGTTSGGGNFNSGTLVTVVATPNVGFTFNNWTENGIIVSVDQSYSFTIIGNRVLVANFNALPAGPGAVALGSAGNFAILAGSAVANTGVTTHIYGDVGSFPTATISGLLSGNVTGTLYTTADPIVGQAKNDLTTAYNDAQGRSLNAISLPGQLGGLTLAPGLYVNSTSSGISGTGPNAILTLDAGGNPNAVWIFKVGSTFITDSGTSIVLAGGAQWKNIYWSIGTSATLGTNSIFYGNILADQSITLTTGALLYGRALTRVAAVTLDTNIVDKR